MSGNVWIKSGFVRNILQTGGVTTTTTGNFQYKDSPNATFQAVVTGSGTVAATVVIDCSNDISGPGNTPQYWCTTTLGTITLSGTTSASDGFTTSAPWKFVRVRVTAISGTNANVQVWMGT